MMCPLFVSIVNDSNHWMFASSSDVLQQEE